jgi:hypothetical protein
MRLLRVAQVLLLAVALVSSQTACLGTMVESPVPARPVEARAQLRWHLITAPSEIDAAECRHGMADVFTFVPLWGLAIGVVTLGIVVPQWTLYSCADRR